MLRRNEKPASPLNFVLNGRPPAPNGKNRQLNRAAGESEPEIMPPAQDQLPGAQKRQLDHALELVRARRP